MSRSFIEKATQFLVIALLPTLFLLGYFRLENDTNGPRKHKVVQLTPDRFITGIDSTMILVAGGKFIMGSNILTDKEMPAHQVEVSTFYIGKTMITVEQFSFFIKATGYKTNAERDSGSFVFNGTSWTIRKSVNWECDELGIKQSIINNNKPVLHVSWYDAHEFCLWLSRISEKKYRLPTEAEWEFAAKGGVKTSGYTYSGGNEVNELSWNGTNSMLKVHPVGQKKPNELGLYDMSGNAWQWCSDWFNKDYYAQSPSKDPQGAESGTLKICHGGSYLSGSGRPGDTGPLNQLNPASRGTEFPYLSASDGSFRIVMQQQ